VVARRLYGVDGEQLLLAALASALTALLAFAGVHLLGLAGLLLPLLVVFVVILVRRPLAMVSVVVGLVIVCEGSNFGLLQFTSHLYDHPTVLNVLVALAVASVGIDMMRRRRPLRLPLELGLPLMTLALAMMVGALTGHAAGVGYGTITHSYNNLDYLLFLPLAVANLDLDRKQIRVVLYGAVALAIVKAFLGLIEVFGGYGGGGAPGIEGTPSFTLSYYEPTANWLIMLAVLGIVAALLIRLRPPLWMLLGAPLLVASLVLSYRRSFWIASVLALLLVLLLAFSPNTRRLLLPAAVLVAAAVWLLGTTHFQSQSPLVRRVESLNPTSLQTNTIDRYRLDERANVLGAIKQHPLTGLGMNVPWSATFHTPSIEYENGRLYVHFVALWFWLKLGLLGLLAYLTLMGGAVLLGWRIWRRAREGLWRVFGLISLCGIAGLMVAETTASFTGIDPRFTVELGAQIGLLALLGRLTAEEG
jgi:O-antigen ligase